MHIIKYCNKNELSYYSDGKVKYFKPIEIGVALKAMWMTVAILD